MNQSEHKVLVVIPTFNERNNVTELLRQLRHYLPLAELVVIDDNSPDGTADVVRRQMEFDLGISLVSRPHKLGVGSAHKDALKLSVERSAKILVTLDADHSHQPKDVTRLLAALADHDVVVGSRFMPEGGLKDWTLPRRILTRLGHLMTKLVLGIHYDATGALRVYRVEFVGSHLSNFELSDGYSWFYESLAVLSRGGARITEVPIILTARTYGSSKMRLRDILFGALNMIRFRTVLRKPNLNIERDSER
jgi:dolichol-phosphate mannosyltransferase